MTVARVGLRNTEGIDQLTEIVVTMADGRQDDQPHRFNSESPVKQTRRTSSKARTN